MVRADESHQVINSVFTPDEMQRAIGHLTSANVERTKAGARHVLNLPVVRTLANDPRVLETARGFIGATAAPFRATLFEKSPAANWLVVWHQDTALPLRRRTDSAEWGPWSTKGGVLYAHAPAWALQQVIALRIGLDDSLSTNGPLRVLPGTHRAGVLGDDEIERLSREVTPFDCVAPSGSIVAMRPLTLHASSKATSEEPRRVLHIEYGAVLDFGSGIELAVA